MYNNDFSTLSICAFRYSLGRRTYMPEIVQTIIKNHIKDIDTLTVGIMIKELKECTNFGDSKIDEPSWRMFEQFLLNEMNERQKQYE